MEYSYELKIPKERIGVLIGAKGETKKQIEKLGHIHIDIDSKQGDVVISSEDSLALYTSRDVVRAIGRGFNPERAMLLLKSDYVFESVDLQDYVGKEKKALDRIRSRVIGTDGKTRRFIEEATECDVVIFGKTVSIIGQVEHAHIAKQAVETLLSGSTHASIYKFLDKKRKEIQSQEGML